MSDEENLSRHVQVRVTQGEHERLTERAGDSIQAFVRGLIISELSDFKGDVPYARRHRRWHEQLEEILNLGTKEQIQAVTGMLGMIAVPGEVAAVRRKSGN